MVQDIKLKPLGSLYIKDEENDSTDITTQTSTPNVELNNDMKNLDAILNNERYFIKETISPMIKTREKERFIQTKFCGVIRIEDTPHTSSVNVSSYGQNVKSKPLRDFSTADLPNECREVRNIDYREVEDGISCSIQSESNTSETNMQGDFKTNPKTTAVSESQNRINTQVKTSDPVSVVSINTTGKAGNIVSETNDKDNFKENLEITATLKSPTEVEVERSVTAPTNVESLKIDKFATNIYKRETSVESNSKQNSKTDDLESLIDIENKTSNPSPISVDFSKTEQNATNIASKTTVELDFKPEIVNFASQSLTDIEIKEDKPGDHVPTSIESQTEPKAANIINKTGINFDFKPYTELVNFGSQSLTDIEIKEGKTSDTVFTSIKSNTEQNVINIASKTTVESDFKQNSETVDLERQNITDVEVNEGKTGYPVPTSIESKTQQNATNIATIKTTFEGNFDPNPISVFRSSSRKDIQGKKGDPVLKIIESKTESNATNIVSKTSVKGNFKPNPKSADLESQNRTFIEIKRSTSDPVPPSVESKTEKNAINIASKTSVNDNSKPNFEAVDLESQNRTFIEIKESKTSDPVPTSVESKTEKNAVNIASKTSVKGNFKANPKTVDLESQNQTFIEIKESKTSDPVAPSAESQTEKNAINIASKTSVKGNFKQNFETVDLESQNRTFIEIKESKTSDPVPTSAESKTQENAINIASKTSVKDNFKPNFETVDLESQNRTDINVKSSDPSNKSNDLKTDQSTTNIESSSTPDTTIILKNLGEKASHASFLGSSLTKEAPQLPNVSQKHSFFLDTLKVDSDVKGDLLEDLTTKREVLREITNSRNVITIVYPATINPDDKSTLNPENTKASDTMSLTNTANAAAQVNQTELEDEECYFTNLCYTMHMVDRMYEELQRQAKIIDESEVVAYLRKTTIMDKLKVTEKRIRKILAGREITREVFMELIYALFHDQEEDGPKTGPEASASTKTTDPAIQLAQKADELKEQGEKIAEVSEHKTQKADELKEQGEKIAEVVEHKTQKADELKEQGEKIAEVEEHKIAETGPGPSQSTVMAAGPAAPPVVADAEDTTKKCYFKTLCKTGRTVTRVCSQVIEYLADTSIMDKIVLGKELKQKNLNPAVSQGVIDGLQKPVKSRTSLSSENKAKNKTSAVSLDDKTKKRSSAASLEKRRTSSSAGSRNFKTKIEGGHK